MEIPNIFISIAALASFSFIVYFSFSTARNLTLLFKHGRNMRAGKRYITRSFLSALVVVLSFAIFSSYYAQLIANNIR